MPVGRRQPPPIPTGAPPAPEFMWAKLLELWRWSMQGYIGLPAPHADTHLATGDDALQAPGVPVGVHLTDAAIGDGPAYAYEDHQHNLDDSVSRAIEDAELMAWMV
jgi:hypothetical protein